MWEGGHRVPAIAAWSGHLDSGTVCDSPCMSMDVMPTLLGAAGVAAPRDRPLDGIDLHDVIARRENVRRALFWNGRAMREGPWKLVLGNDDRASLFDLSADLGEVRDVAATHPERERVMRAALARWREDVARDATRQPSDR